MDSGFMALSIYCVQMAPKWSCVLDSQPIQGKDMSVQVYYDQFCSWRSKLEAVNYIGDEEWYVDDFLCGLKMDLVVRVLGYKWRPRRLSDAFRRAEIEEIMLSWKENPRKNDADEVFEEMSHPESVNSAELGAEDISDENSDDVLDASGLIATNADFCSMLQAINSVREDVGGLGGLGKTSDNVIDPIQESEFSSFEAGIQLVEKAEQSFPSKLEVVELAYEMFDEMTDLVPTARHSFSSVSLIRNERNDDSVLNRADYCKFDEVLGPFSVKHNTRIDIQEVLEPPTFALLKILGCDFIISNGLKQDFDKMASNLNVELWVGMVPMFVFDPGGSSLYLRGCSSLKLNGDKQNCDFWINEFTSTKAELCWTDLYSCNENSPVYSTFGECKNALYFTDHDALFLFDPGGSYYLLRAWNWNDAFVICEKQQGRNMAKKSGIYNIEADQHNQVGDLSCTYVGIFEFGGPFGKLQITCKYIQGLFHAWGILEFKLMADSIAYPSLISSPWLPGSRSPLTKQGIGAVIDKTRDIGLDSWKEQHEDTLVSLVALGFRDLQNATKTFFGKVGGGLGVVMVFFSTGLAITNLLYNNFEKCPPLAPVYESTRYGDSFTAAASQIGMQKGSWELSVTVTGNLCVWTSHCSFHYYEERFLRGHKNVVLVRSTFLENFVWDPGLCAVLVHILEDKDVFEGVGNDDTHEYYIGDIWILHPWGIGIVLIMKQMGFLNGIDGKRMMIYCEGGYHQEIKIQGEGS